MATPRTSPRARSASLNGRMRSMVPLRKKATLPPIAGTRPRERSPLFRSDTGSLLLLCYTAISKQERRHPAIDHETGTGDEGGVVGKEKGDRCRNLLGAGDARDHVPLETEAELFGTAGGVEHCP